MRDYRGMIRFFAASATASGRRVTPRLLKIRMVWLLGVLSPMGSSFAIALFAELIAMSWSTCASQEGRPSWGIGEWESWLKR